MEFEFELFSPLVSGENLQCFDAVGWGGPQKGIQPVKKLGDVECWHGYLYGTMRRFAYGPDDAIATHWLLL